MSKRSSKESPNPTSLASTSANDAAKRVLDLQKNHPRRPAIPQDSETPLSSGVSPTRRSKAANVSPSLDTKAPTQSPKGLEAKDEDLQQELNFARLEKTLAEQLGPFRTEMVEKIGEAKSSLLRWAIGILATILLGIIGFYYSTTDRLTDKIESLQDKVSTTQSRVTTLEGQSHLNVTTKSDHKH